MVLQVQILAIVGKSWFLGGRSQLAYDFVTGDGDGIGRSILSAAFLLLRILVLSLEVLARRASLVLHLGAVTIVKLGYLIFCRLLVII